VRKLGKAKVKGPGAGDERLLANKLGALSTRINDRLSVALGGRSQSASAVLLTLANWGPLGVTELGRILGVSQPTCSRVTSILEREGLIRRQSRIGRDVRLELTAGGATTAAELEDARLNDLATLLLPLDDKDRDLLHGLLDRLLAASTTGRPDARHTCRMCAHSICDGPDCPIGTRATQLESD